MDNKILLIILTFFLGATGFAQTFDHVLIKVRVSEASKSQGREAILAEIFEKAWHEKLAMDPDYLVEIEKEFYVRGVPQSKYQSMLVVTAPVEQFTLEQTTPGHLAKSLRRMLWSHGVNVNSQYVELAPGNYVFVIRTVEISADYFKAIQNVLSLAGWKDMQPYADHKITISKVVGDSCKEFFR